MKLIFTKKAAVQSFLNGKHGPVMAALAGGIASGVTLIATARPALAGEMFRRFWQQRDFKLGTRRLSWYLRRSWIGLHLSEDQMFVFPTQMPLPALLALRAFLEGRKGRVEPGMLAGDLTYVSAAIAMEQHGTPGFPAAMAGFGSDVDAMLAQTALVTPSSQPKVVSVKKGRLSIADAEQALRDFATAFPIDRTPWFILSGTFLGLVREGGLLQHDYDIDIGVMADDVDCAALADRIRAHPDFHLRAYETQVTLIKDAAGRDVADERPILMKVTHKAGTHIDVFVHYRDGDVIWHGSALFRWDNSAFDLQPYDFVGTRVLAPVDADRYLTENYGNWRVPVTDFHSAIDTTNQKVVENPLSIAIFLRRAWVAAHADARTSAGLLRLLRREGCVEMAADGTTYRFAPGKFGSAKPH